MPVIHVELWEGRPQAVRDALAADISAAVVKHLEIPPEYLTLIFTEVAKSDWYVGGKPS
jgi:4-oxalocrotonate tautomerase